MTAALPLGAELATGWEPTESGSARIVWAGRYGDSLDVTACCRQHDDGSTDQAEVYVDGVAYTPAAARRYAEAILAAVGQAESWADQ